MKTAAQIKLEYKYGRTIDELREYYFMLDEIDKAKFLKQIGGGGVLLLAPDQYPKANKDSVRQITLFEEVHDGKYGVYRCHNGELD